MDGARSAAGDAVADGLRLGQLQRPFRFACGKRRLPSPKQDREDHQAQLVDEVVFDQDPTRVALPATRMTAVDFVLQGGDGGDGSPLRTVVFCHSGRSIVAETTYFGISFIFLAKPASSSRSGQAAAKPS